jgi:VanZ family protein
MIKKNIFSSIIALVILFLSFTGSGTFDKLNIPDIPYLDKIVHLGMYFAFMLALMFENRAVLTSVKKYIILSTIPVLYGTAIEFLQTLLTRTRSGDFFDACFNVLGVTLAILIWFMFKKLWKPGVK